MDFDPANGGRFRASTQAEEGDNINAKEVRGLPATPLRPHLATMPAVAWLSCGKLLERGILHANPMIAVPG